MKVKKRGFSLLEILISLVLALGVLAGVLYFWRWIAVSEAKLHKDEEFAFSLRRLQARLTELLSEAVSIPVAKKGAEEEKKILFYLAPQEEGLTLGPSLLFSAFNDVIDPMWRGTVVSRLLIDAKKRLLVASWPFPPPLEGGNVPMHIEVLMENVEGMSVEFLPWQEEASFPDIRPGEWTSLWRKEFEALPVAIKIRLFLPYPHTVAIPLPLCPRGSS